MYTKINYRKFNLIFEINLIDYSTTKYRIRMFFKSACTLLFIYFFVCLFALAKLDVRIRDSHGIDTDCHSGLVISKSANFPGKLKECRIANKSS